MPELGLNTAIIPKLIQFAELVLERNQVMNLTAITEPKAVASLHLLDSLTLISEAGLERENMIDVGCGAGFPGVPLAIALPESRITLLDSLGKRIDFLREACEKLELQNTTCIHARAEEFALTHREQYDIAVSRAVASLPVLCELCLPLLRTGGRMLAMKSSHSDGEVESALSAVKILGGRVAWTKDCLLPCTDVTHRIICIEKSAPCPKKYPRRFALIKKNPL